MTYQKKTITTGFYNLQEWQDAADPSLTLADFEGKPCYLGISLASKLDLNAVVPVFMREIDGVRHFYCVGAMFWAPKNTVYSSDPELKRTAERYQSFVNQGVLIPTDGAEVDYRVIFESIIRLHSRLRIKDCSIDPYGAVSISHMLYDEGLCPVTYVQNFTNMSDPMREIEAALAAGRFHHDGNPLLTWCIQNVVGKYYAGSDDVVRPIKEGSGNNIDGAVCLMMAVGRVLASKATKKNENP